MTRVPKDEHRAQAHPSREAILKSFVSPPAPAVGTPLSQDEIDLYKKARDAMWPIARIATYDDFSKWLFTIIAVIGTLGAAFSNAAFKVMRPEGAVAFGVALLLASIALAASVLSRASDFPADTNWMSPEALTNATQLMRRKRSLVGAAGICFAMSLLCASAAPMLSFFESRSYQGSLTLSPGKDGMHVGFVLSSKGDKTGELTLIGIQDKNESLLSYQRATSDESGNLKLDGNTPVLGATFTGLRILVTCDLERGKRQEIMLPIGQGAVTETHEELQKALSSGACTSSS